MELWTVGVMGLAAVGLVAYALWPKSGGNEEAIKRRMKGRSSQPQAGTPLRRPQRTSVAKRVMQTVAPIAVRPGMMGSQEQMSKLRMRLAAAGYRTEGAPMIFLASKTVVALLAAVIGLAYAFSRGDTVQYALGIALCAGGFGFLAPNFWLSMATNTRQELVRNGLPDTLDLMVISVESGLGLDAALQRVSDEMSRVHPILAEEMQLVTLETQMGIPRSEALGNLVNRTNLAEIKSLVAMVNQAERFGTSIARALRNQSDALRTKRRQAAEERAQKTTVKLMAPLILFIFPAILVVLAGPAALKLIDALGSNSAL